MKKISFDQLRLGDVVFDVDNTLSIDDFQCQDYFEVYKSLHKVRGFGIDKNDSTLGLKAFTDRIILTDGHLEFDDGIFFDDCNEGMNNLFRVSPDVWDKAIILYNKYMDDLHNLLPKELNESNYVSLNQLRLGDVILVLLKKDLGEDRPSFSKDLYKVRNILRNVSDSSTLEVKTDYISLDNGRVIMDEKLYSFREFFTIVNVNRVSSNVWDKAIILFNKYIDDLYDLLNIEHGILGYINFLNNKVGIAEEAQTVEKTDAEETGTDASGQETDREAARQKELLRRERHDAKVAVLKEEVAAMNEEVPAAVACMLGVLSLNDQRIYHAIRRNDGVQAQNIAEILPYQEGVERPSIATVNRSISSLTKAGLIEREGSKKTGQYVIKKVDCAPDSCPVCAKSSFCPQFGHHYII